jgi:2,5-furandicarboxylate decarboxylase 1
MDFRTFITQLEAEGDLLRIDDPVKLDYEAGALCRELSDADGPAALLSKVGDFDIPLAVNVYGTRARVAKALGVTEDRLLEHVAANIKNRTGSTPFQGGTARCQEVVIIGNDIDVGRLPFPLWNLGDGGRYMTASLVIAKHPTFGWNVAHHRCQIYNGQELGICMAPEHHLRLATDEARRNGTRAEAAIALGVRPSITIAASSDFPLADYELNVAGALEGKPIAVVKCKTVDVEVPEDTEVVIEGYFTGELRDEGPFVEFTGYQTKIIQSPVFRITAITHRKSPVLHGIFAGKPPCETNTLWRELEEAEAYETLRRRFPMLTAVHRPPQVGRDFIGILQVNTERTHTAPGAIRTLMLATAAVMPRLKFIIAIDHDIDIYNLTDVMWAVATRCDPKADAALVEGTMTSWLDPSSRGFTGKLYLDATKGPTFSGEMPGFPDESLERARQLIAAATARKGR